MIKAHFWILVSTRSSPGYRGSESDVSAGQRSRIEHLYYLVDRDWAGYFLCQFNTRPEHREGGMSIKEMFPSNWLDCLCDN